MQAAILWPVIAQATLTFAVLIIMGMRRRRALAEAGLTVHDPDVALGRNHWSDEAVKASKNYDNLLEMPVLFYAVAAFALIVRAADAWMVGLAWIFFAARLGHTIEHLGRNRVPVRGTAFLVAAVALLLMWLSLALRIL